MSTYHISAGVATRHTIVAIPGVEYQVDDAPFLLFHVKHIFVNFPTLYEKFTVGSGPRLRMEPWNHLEN